MPNREFDCTACDNRFISLIRPFHEDEDMAETRCPECGSGDLQMVLISSHGDYQIRGDNSASVRPRKSRSNQ